jgi:anti-sigma B factor antagonist
VDANLTPDTELVHRIALFGDVDIARRAELGRLVSSFRRSTARQVEVDLSGVDFLDSTGLAAIFKLHRIAQTRGGRVLLLAPVRPVRRILDVSGAAAVCEIVDP